MAGEVLTPALLASRWGVSTTLVYDLLNSGKLTGFRLGKLWRVRVADVEAYEGLSTLPKHTAAADAPSALHGPPKDPQSEAARARVVARMVRLGY